jgi:hypothetical protein
LKNPGPEEDVGAGSNKEEEVWWKRDWRRQTSQSWVHAIPTAVCCAFLPMKSKELSSRGFLFEEWRKPMGNIKEYCYEHSGVFIGNVL